MQGYDPFYNNASIGICNVRLLPIIQGAKSLPPSGFNLISNGILSSPTISDGTFINSSALSSSQLVGWTHLINPFTKIFNGDNAYTFPSSPTTQHFSLTGITSNISQTINFSPCGTGALTLNYAFLNSYNPIKVFISLSGNNVLYINTSTNTSSWLSYLQIIIINQIGNNTISLAGAIASSGS